jgi:hypothetical protein
MLCRPRVNIYSTEATMQTTWSRDRFALNLHTQTWRANLTGGALIGCRLPKTAISTPLASASILSSNRFMLGDENGSGFQRKSDAMLAGIDAAKLVTAYLLSLTFDRPSEM